jgi:uncharacterized membrane protein YsdA (DUF1294 family)
VQWLLAYLVVANLVSFAMFGIDKGRAQAGERRISERALLLSAVVSGTIGAWAGMSVFRHKTAKRTFQTKMVAMTVVDVAIVVLALLATR